jgi:Asp-tRNA(Asn)/Glu-tRNA(Gln) amidotransferase A subunit family amidase
MGGKPLRNYYHWLSLTYVVTLATNPAISIPCGIDHTGFPFGLQAVGRARADGFVLSAAHAMEQAFNGNADLKRPLPDLKKLVKPTPALKSIVTAAPKRTDMK